MSKGKKGARYQVLIRSDEADGGEAVSTTKGGEDFLFGGGEVAGLGTGGGIVGVRPKR